MDSRPPKSVLIVLHGAIGDVVRALPLAVRIKQAWPETHLAWGVEPIAQPMVESHPAIDEVIVFNRPKGLLAFISYLAELRSKRFELVLDLQRHFKSGVTSFLSGGARRVGFHRKSAKEFNWLFNSERIEQVEHFSPKIQYYQKFGDQLNLPTMDVLEFGLAPTVEERHLVEQLFRAASAKRGISYPEPSKRVAFILGSTWPSRFWSKDHFVHVAKQLHQRHGFVPVLIGHTREEQFAAEIESELGELPVINLVKQTTVRELVGVFSEVALAIGSDSGPMHIAAACKIPVVSLWGSTSPKRSAPYGSEHLALQSPVGCSPCYQRICPGLDTLCMKDLPAEAVLGMVSRVLHDRRDGAGFKSAQAQA